MIIDWINQVSPDPDQQARNAAKARQAVLTKPAGSLGQLEQIAVDFAGWQAREQAELDTINIRVFAADHGVCQQGVSAYPQEVTAQMVQNFLNGGAAISVLAQGLGADFAVVNLGTVTALGNDIDKAINLDNQFIANSTADFSVAAAMSESQLAKALNVGRNQVSNSPNAAQLFIGGEMGIGNTSAASAIYSALLGLPAAETVGPGTGIDRQGQKTKAEVIERALSLHAGQLDDALSVLRCVGGFEIAALVGAYISSAQQKTPVLVDGFICTAAALLACEINASCRAWMLFAHQSAEPAHVKALEKLNAKPLLKLEMRLGEGSGAAVAVPIIKSALSLHANMATFATAGVSDGSGVVNGTE